MQSEESRPISSEISGEKLPYPASQADMALQPDTDLSSYLPAGKLSGKVALVTGGDSGIGRAVALAFAMEGAEVAIFYNENEEDANTTRTMVEAQGQRCLAIKGDVRHSEDCRHAIERTVVELGGLNILVNNAAYQMAQKKFEDISEEQFRRTLETNIFGYFYMAQAALPYLSAEDAIINTGSIVGLVGNEMLIDYCASKGAIHAFTKALALNLADRKIRVNAIAPGPVWTPNIPATMPIEEVENFGHEVALGRPGQPEELAPAYVFLASKDSSFITGSIIEVTGGKLSSG
ncbi:MAG: short-chain dehydrogenase [Leptolyngbya sp.]|uniref:glucose 1-dehydrogenase n=1 Tax=Leptolyngbya sp. Cla-17 TaxID=2803751 RepID=UPI000DB67FA6|nr:glucose 1-dehydrogenase [Leptolyngbya sp. Cla-17]MBM0745364.1 glucose 1-dehydrogenase [Leptolyngbya sp. Cla-17]PZV07287.1 MAG: short-chain dehydrogenase [Leptolyngbya sp.]